ncbi:MAG: Asp-tRNA(Asn)/Glu-tRNA(Gln) amidotransferase subunit GatC [Schwartzia sp.]|jgi:aspartyl/glutamyl-tRNA(Asn/Gln) amidotransferase, C subunit|nr:Asp-tRNA(Asn)/Glu-tRNA(Gln) amidotransferase subunit GatC [Schwartzia sp. (in: firmicutes)]
MTVEILKALESLNEFRLTDSEEQKAMEVFGFMENEAEELRSIDTENVDVMVHCMPMTNVFREDVREQPFTREQLLEGAPEHSEDSWIVPRLVK